MSRSSDVKDVVFCPDCGGVIGATQTDEFGHPCTCFVGARKPATTPVEPPADIEPSPTDPGGADAGDEPGDGQPQKLCVLCGKNVAGHRRVKDSRGYLCLDCHRTEQARQKPQGVKCPRCGRVVKAESVGEFDGARMCQRCLREAREVRRPGSKRFRKIDDRHFQEKSKTQLFVLIGIAGVLALIILISWLTR